MDTKFEQKPAIVMDEFQYIGRSNPAFPSVFQRIWEEILKNKSVMVIHHEFYPEKSRRELIEMYSVTGGVPKYIELFSECPDVYQAIGNCILNRSGYLYDEPYFLLQQEVSQVGSYFSIIKAIAAGNRKLSSIATVLETKATDLTRYLKTLMDLDILVREIPVTDENPEKSKKGLYQIRDNYIRFWFSFVYPNMSFIERGQGQIVMDKIRKGFISQQAAFVYEDVCRERMWELNAKQSWPFYFSRVGRYWDSKVEIDIAALDPEGHHLILGECKFWQEPVGINILRELEKKALNVEWQKKQRRLWYVLFSSGGFTPELRALADARGDILLVDDSV